MPPKSSSKADDATKGIEDYELPKALVTRIAKSVLPEKANLPEPTKLALVKAATVFINYLAATAQDVAKSRSHKTINSPDILRALEIVEFKEFIPILERELAAKNETQGSSKEKEKAIPDAKTTAKSKKGKERADVPISSPFTSTPLQNRGGAVQSSTVMEESGDGDEEVIGRNEEEEEMLEQEEEEPEEEEEEYEEEPEELVDEEAADEEQLRLDAQGLDRFGAEASAVDTDT